jgi:PGF-pre-PGF domain-containing protein
MANGVVAQDISAGSCESYDLSGLDNSDISYNVTGNNLDLEGLEITIENYEANVCTPINYAPDEFNITFYNPTRIEYKINETSEESNWIDKILSNYGNLSVVVLNETPLSSSSISQFKIFNITTENESTGKIFFKVDKYLINNKDKVFLYVFESSWTKLETYFIKDNGLEFEYYAITPHFSTFMIGEDTTITSSSSSSGSHTIYKNNTINNTIYIPVVEYKNNTEIKEINTTCNKPKENKSNWDLTKSILLGIAIVCLIGIYLIQKKTMLLNNSKEHLNTIKT